MSDFKEGDLVEAVKGEEVRRGRVYTNDSWSDARLCLVYLPLSTYQREDWTLTLIEAAKPADILPKEPGLYADKDGEPWSLDKIGVWWYGASTHSNAEDRDVLAGYAPFTRLEPVPVTAKKIIDRIQEMCDEREGWLELGTVQQVIAAEFGVES